MSITKAIETARRRVFRDGRTTYIYDEHADATRHMQHATVAGARAACREALVRAALSSLNLPASTICSIVWGLPTTGSWTDYVRASTNPAALDAEAEHLSPAEYRAWTEVAE